MKKNTATLTLTFYYLVDHRGHIFTTAVDDTNNTVHVSNLENEAGEQALFESEAYHLKQYARENGIHYGEEVRTFDFSTTVMTDVDKQWVANIFCWRQDKVEGLPLTQPRHLKPI